MNLRNKSKLKKTTQTIRYMTKYETILNRLMLELEFDYGFGKKERERIFKEMIITGTSKFYLPNKTNNNDRLDKK